MGGRSLSVGVAIAVLCGLLVTPVAAVPTAEAAAVTGVVTDGDTTAPLANVTVRMSPGDLSAVTDSTGAFSITGVADGPYTANVELTDGSQACQSDEIAVTVSGADASLDIAVGASGDLDYRCSVTADPAFTDGLDLITLEPGDGVREADIILPFSFGLRGQGFTSAVVNDLGQIVMGEHVIDGRHGYQNRPFPHNTGTPGTGPVVMDEQSSVRFGPAPSSAGEAVVIHWAEVLIGGNRTSFEIVLAADGGVIYTYPEFALHLLPRHAPVAVIDAPSSTLRWSPGGTIDFSGHAVAAGAHVPADQLSWELLARECAAPGDCTDESLDSQPGVAAGTFTAPTQPGPDTILVIELTATVDGGRSDTASVELQQSPDASQSPVSDDFSAGSLNADLWTVSDPAGSANVSIVGAGTDNSRLLLDVPAGINYDPYHINRALRVTQPVANADFEVEAGFTSTPSTGIQGHGILVEQDADNWLRWDLYSDGTTLEVYAGVTTDGTTSTLLNEEVSGTPDRLRLTRVGDEWTFAYSDGGATWTTAGTATHPLSVTAVGPMALSTGSQQPGYGAEIDYFFNTDDPVIPEDGVNQPPIAAFTSHCTTTGCDLDATGSGDPDGTIVSYDWDFGDGSSAAGAVIEHEFASQGLHPVTLTVTDDSGDTTEKKSVLSTAPPMSDDFSTGALDTQLWSVTDPASAGTVSIVGAGSEDVRLVLDIPAGVDYDPYDVNRALRATQPLADVDFEVEVGFEDVPELARQGHGIMVEQDDDNWLRFDIYRRWNGILTAYAGATVDGSTTELFSSDVYGSPEKVRVKRVGDDWTLSYSDDGVTWTQVGSATHALHAKRVGPHALSDEPWHGYSAEVDYFFNTADPVLPEDGTNQPPVVAVASTCRDNICDFDATTSVDLDGNIAGYTWRFDDGQTATGSATSHRFAMAGIHNVELDVIDDVGEMSTKAVRVSTALAASDDFADATLDAQLWSVIDPTGLGSVSIVGAGTPDSRLKLEVPAEVRSDPYHSNTALRVMQPVADEDLDLTVSFTATPTGDSQGHGILIEQDANNWLRFDMYRTYLGELKIFVGSTTQGQTSGLLHHTASLTAIRTTCESYVPVTYGDSQFRKTDRIGTTWELFHI